MTAQIGEILIFNGVDTRMATEPLNQYLQKRSDIKFIETSTACWRGYYGQWEIKDNKLYLIGLKAYIKGYREVDLNYLFPGEKQVFAHWFTGEIRIPQGELLDYVHMGYASLYAKDLFLVFENGVLVKQYEVDNAEKYRERLKTREQEERERLAVVTKKKKEDRIFNIVAVTILVFAFIGICIGIFYLIKWGTILAYIIVAAISIGVIFLIYTAIKNRIKNNKRYIERMYYPL